jgi:hypothetical protein
MEVKDSLQKLGSLFVDCESFEPGRLQLLVYFAQSLGDSFGYAFEIHHFRVFSHELETDLARLQGQHSNSVQLQSDVSNFVAKAISSARLEEVELAAAQMYFENKGYSAAEIADVLNPDAQLLKRALAIVSELRSFEPKSLATVGSR